MKIYAIAFAITLTLFSNFAFAYIDPGSGFMLLQGLLAAIGAVIFFFRQPLVVIKKLIKRFFGKDRQ
jgi:hypothetical protein